MVGTVGKLCDGSVRKRVGVVAFDGHGVRVGPEQGGEFADSRRGVGDKHSRGVGQLGGRRKPANRDAVNAVSAGRYVGVNPSGRRVFGGESAVLLMPSAVFAESRPVFRAEFTVTARTVIEYRRGAGGDATRTGIRIIAGRRERGEHGIDAKPRVRPSAISNPGNEGVVIRPLSLSEGFGEVGFGGFHGLGEDVLAALADVLPSSSVIRAPIMQAVSESSKPVTADGGQTLPLPPFTTHYEPAAQGGEKYVRCDDCGRELLSKLGGCRKLSHAADCPHASE